MFKTPVMRKSLPPILGTEPQPQPTKRGRSSEDFLMFCNMILDYENYEDGPGDSAVRYRHTSSPLGSTGSTGSSLSLGSAGEQMREEAETSPRLPLPRQHSDTETDTVTDDYDDGEEEEITCYCRKPYGGRPMIECSSCLTWVHLTCAKVKRSAIPDTWLCSLCKQKPSTKITKQSGSRAHARKVISGALRRKSGVSSSATSPPTSSSSATGTTTIFRSSSKRKL